MHCKCLPTLYRLGHKSCKAYQEIRLYIKQSNTDTRKELNTGTDTTMNFHIATDTNTGDEVRTNTKRIPENSYRSTQTST